MRLYIVNTNISIAASLMVGLSLTFVAFTRGKDVEGEEKIEVKGVACPAVTELDGTVRVSLKNVPFSMSSVRREKDGTLTIQCLEEGPARTAFLNGERNVDQDQANQNEAVEVSF